MYDKVKDEYLAQAQRLLATHPAELASFEKDWSTGKFRLAYLRVYEVMKDCGTMLSDDERKVDEIFFGLWVN